MMSDCRVPQCRMDRNRPPPFGNRHLAIGNPNAGRGNLRPGQIIYNVAAASKVCATRLNLPGRPVTHCRTGARVDAITIERARRQDRAAQAQLLRHLQDPWFRLCRSLLRGDDELAHDATQETALRFLRDLPRFRGDSSITTWSMGIALNVVREMRRSRQGAETLDRRRLTAPAAEALTPPDESAQRSELDSILRATLNDLSDRQREAIVLRFFEEMSIEETARSMGCAAGTVKATVHQALRILRDKLRQLS